MAEVARLFRRHQDQRGRAVVLLAAIEQAPGFDDPARGVVGFGRERPAVHHRARIGLGMVIGGERDGALRRIGDLVLVQEAHRAHGVALRRRHHAVGRVERRLAGGDAARRRGAEALELALRQRPEHHDAIGHAAGHRRRGIAHGGRSAAPAAAPVHVGEAQRRQAERGGQARRIVAVVGVGGEAVDAARIDAGILAGRQDRLQGELELGDRRLAVLVVGGLADTGDRHLAAKRALAHGLAVSWCDSAPGPRSPGSGRSSAPAPWRARRPTAAPWCARSPRPNAARCPHGADSRSPT